MAKKLTEYDPFETLFDLREDFDKMFRNFASGFASPDVSRTMFPLMDIKERKNEILVEAEVPGLDKKDINISLKKDELVIQGEKKEEEKKEGESFLRVERSYGKFRRSIKLPSNIKSEDIKADYNNGVLRIHLPKTEEEKPKEIPIKVS